MVAVVAKISVLVLSLVLPVASGVYLAETSRPQDSEALQPLSTQPLAPSAANLPGGGAYIPSTPETVRWGSLPNRDAKPLLTVPSGAVVTFDTVSHEGILEDQGREPVKYFGGHGVLPNRVLDDAKAIASSSIVHDFVRDGPHVVTGPIAIEGAEPGDVLKIETLSLVARVPYGVISNRHGKGALPGELPENEGPQPGAGAEHPELYSNVSVFAPIEEMAGEWYGVLDNQAGEKIRFRIQPFMGILGVAPDTSEIVNSIPPAEYGGNLDINELGVGSTLYLPVHVPGALFYTGDPRPEAA